MADILGVAISGLKASQALMSNTSMNIANAATAGYHRRTTAVSASPDVVIGGQSLGTGVTITGTSRTIDDIQQNIYRQNLSSQSEFYARTSFSEQINNLLSGDETSISTGINDFFTSLQGLSNKPSDTAARSVVLNEANSLVAKITTMNGLLQDLVNDMNYQTQAVVNQINSIATNIVQLNVNILASSSVNIEPSTLLDQRDNLLDQLAALVNVQTIAQADGGINVLIGNSQPLVVGIQQMPLAAVTNPNDPSRMDIVNTLGGNNVITDEIVGGQIGGLYSIRNDVIDYTQTRMNRVTMVFANSINAQHKLGIDFNGNFGGNLFTDYNSYTMQTQRSIQSRSNHGTAQFAVSIADVLPAKTPPFTVYSNASNIVAVAGLPSLTSGDLTINGIAIRAPVGADDTVSSTDNAKSAIALANAINSSAGNFGITATAKPNALNLGTFTSGAFLANQFAINGTNIISTGANQTTLLQDINAQSATTGVTAVATGPAGNQITLVAKDGRNIRLTSNGLATGTFQYFAANGGAALDDNQRAAISLTSMQAPIVIAGNNPAHAGLTASTTPAPTATLTDSSYTLAYNGTRYSLTRQSDNVVVATSATSVLSADGIVVSLMNGAPVAGDSFTINPTVGGAQNFSCLINDITKLAMASPIKVNKATSMPGSAAQITRGSITNATGLPLATAGQYGNAFSTANKLSPPIKIQIFADSVGNPSILRVFDMTNGGAGVQIGTDQTYNPTGNNQIFPMAAVNNTTFPGPNASYVYDPGYRVAISGVAVAGDVFTVGYNTNAPEDNGNAINLRNLQSAILLSGNTTTYQSEYNNLISSVGTIASTDDSNYNVAQSLVRSSSDKLQEEVGVNLDEEATNIIKFHQFYQASAQIIAIARTCFDSLLAAVAA